MLGTKAVNNVKNVWGHISFLSELDFNESMNNAVQSINFQVSCSEWLLGKVNGGATGCRNIRHVQLNKFMQCARWRGMCLLPTVLWHFEDGFGGTSTWEKHHHDLQSTFWDKFELTGDVWKNERWVVERHWSVCTADNVVSVHEVLLWVQEICDLITWYRKDISIHDHAVGLMLHLYRIQVVHMLTTTNKQQRCEPVDAWHSWQPHACGLCTVNTLAWRLPYWMCIRMKTACA
jgi:hypothetical protein